MSADAEYKGYTLVKAGEKVSTLYVTQFPDRKLPSLAIEQGNAIVILAIFSSDKAAQTFMQWMDCITRKEVA
jgi:hypothetical protein